MPRARRRAGSQEKDRRGWTSETRSRHSETAGRQATRIRWKSKENRCALLRATLPNLEPVQKPQGYARRAGRLWQRASKQPGERESVRAISRAANGEMGRARP